MGKAHQLPHPLVRPIAPASSAGGSMKAAADLLPAGLRTVADSVGGHTQQFPAPRVISVHDPHSIQRLQPGVDGPQPDAIRSQSELRTIYEMVLNITLLL